jgi:bacteriocin-like protein
MSNDTVDPSKKDPQISSADDLTKTTNKGEAELSEEELKRISGGVPSDSQDKLSWIDVHSFQWGTGR